MAKFRPFPAYDVALSWEKMQGLESFPMPDCPDCIGGAVGRKFSEAYRVYATEPRNRPLHGPCIPRTVGESGNGRDGAYGDGGRNDDQGPEVLSPSIKISPESNLYPKCSTTSIRHTGHISAIAYTPA